MTLAREIAGSQHRVLDCVKLASVWVASFDHEFSDDEAAAIRTRLPDLEHGVPVARMAQLVGESLRAGRAGDFIPIFELIRATLAESARDAFLRLVVDIAAADGRIAVVEKHALMFLADLVGRSPQLPGFYEDATGMKFALPQDPSEPAFWAAAEADPRRGDDGGETTPRRARADADLDDSRAAALATLGLAGEPSQEELRAAWQRLNRVHHPDRYQGLDAETIAHATRAFQRVQAAYRLLAEDD